MNCPRKRSLIGKWWIIEMELWDKACLDMVEPAYIQFMTWRVQVQLRCLWYRLRLLR